MKSIKTLFTQTDIVNNAIELLKEHEPDNGYWLAFSGGKDSQVIYHLTLTAGVKFKAYYNITTADPPELLKFIKSNYPDVEMLPPEITMWKLIPQKLMPPTRLVRYCCEYLKERSSKGENVITGIRADESLNRKNKRKMIELCIPKNTITINPIFYWSDFEVWEFLRINKIESCELYKKGFDRLGCIGCPMQGTDKMRRDFTIWPTYRVKYIKAFEEMLKARKERQLPCQWENGEDVMAWWLKDKNGDEFEDTSIYKGKL